MFGLIGHSSSFAQAQEKARELGLEEMAEADMLAWCSAPPQLLETFQVTSRTGKTIEGTYIDSCFVPEMLSRFKTATRKVQNAMEMAQKQGINVTALGGFTSIIFENYDLSKFQQIRNTTLEWQRFTTALEAGKVPTCLLIQALLIEAFAISAYHIYIPVADPFARKITEGVVKDEYTHLNYGQEWLKANLESCREELEQANRDNLPLIRRMLDQVAADAAVLHMDKEDLIEDFLIAYQEALTEIGFSTREIARMAAAALVG